MDEEPLVRVVRGEPADDELAALTVLLAARSAEVDAVPASPGPTAWTRSARPSPKASSWRESGRPR
jgi:hypothetical protein